jgi:protein phosphatase 1 regulatory subunit 11
MQTRINAYSDRPGQTASRADGSRTITIHDVPTGEEGRGDDAGQGSSQEAGRQNEAGVLRLRGGGNTRKVVWSEETVDNEGMGKKKSKSKSKSERNGSC